MGSPCRFGARSSSVETRMQVLKELMALVFVFAVLSLAGYLGWMAIEIAHATSYR